ncbi:uncharacterized protein B0P05DRAFT_364700 [Gilbertella persicaria]|uniref:uncharacterized protein n=1 Tax=Gilbertella persicaria TaxID=101096 RepID=UPI00221F21A5|nr:uncharacterized protein B0P05DRAFT_364700 [Gilbertella persicaria]KAI8047365.1 hypothetical protein B0P05DRAFT_364700 [Gilbertella persicaria]
MNQERISMIKDPIEIFQILQNMPKRLIDCHSFMDHVFSPSNLFSTINPSDISIKREYFNDRLRQHCQSKKRF